MDYIQLTTLFPFERAFQIVTRRADIVLEKMFGCGRREMWVLLCVVTDGRSQRDVGTRLGLHPNVVVKILDGMEETGLLQRRQKREDRRARTLEITAKGKTVVEKYQRERSAVLANVFAPLNEAQRDQLREMVLAIAKEAGLAGTSD